MRPGQLTPENESPSTETPPESHCFNEAGAINPGKQKGDTLNVRVKKKLQ